ncbi:MAG: bifunctional indole-3-glycerol phosphate synthase/tryptophan synthase subunit beta, partial [Bifidobacteriales bacterium]|nr:bifunctional indole-3-glycerol phosphate synthase/tryptophan synthase subunit beta [Bifidobacteriales bacterium]
MTVLDELVAGAVEDARARVREIPLEKLKEQVGGMKRRPLDVARLLKESAGIPVIAEIKRASPSKGYLADIKDPAAL